MKVNHRLPSNGYRHKKKFGQHFIHDVSLLQRIATIAKGRDYVLEIGAGSGTLTAVLAQQFKQVVALEIDRDLAPMLKQNLKEMANVSLHFTDACTVDYDQLMRDVGMTNGYTVVANLPYYITTPLTLQLLESAPAANELVLLMQKEVAERFVANPNSKAYGAPSLAIQYRASAKIAFGVDRAVFTPRPEVDSAVLYLSRYNSPPYPANDEALFRQVVRAAFGQRRKTLRNALRSTGLPLKQIEQAAQDLHLSLNRRGESLSLKEFVALTNALSEEVAHESRNIF